MSFSNHRFQDGHPVGKRSIICVYFCSSRGLSNHSNPLKQSAKMQANALADMPLMYDKNVSHLTTSVSANFRQMCQLVVQHMMFEFIFSISVLTNKHC